MISRAATLACALTIVGVTPAVFATQLQSVVASMNVMASRATGTILSIDLEKKTFSLKTSDDEIKISFTNSTEFTLDGKPSSMSESLKAGRNATVTHADGAASKVDVQSS